MFCVCDRSSAASTSSRMYMGAGLNCRRAMMRERATSDLLLAKGTRISKAVTGETNEKGDGEGELTADHHSAPLDSASTPCQGRP